MRADKPQEKERDASSESEKTASGRHQGAGFEAVTGDVGSGHGKTARFRPILERGRVRHE